MIPASESQLWPVILSCLMVSAFVLLKSGPLLLLETVPSVVLCIPLLKLVSLYLEVLLSGVAHRKCIAPQIEYTTSKGNMDGDNDHRKWNIPCDSCSDHDDMVPP
jgi:hypothetical protein